MNLEGLDNDKPMELVLLDFVELLRDYDCIEFAKSDVVAYICAGKEIGYRRIAENPHPFLRVSIILKNESIFEEAFQHAVGKQLTSESDRDFLGRALASMVNKEVEMTRLKVLKVYDGLLALRPSTIYTSDDQVRALGSHVFHNFLRTIISCKDPMSEKSYRGLRLLADKVTEPELLTKQALGSLLSSRRRRLANVWRAHKNLQGAIEEVAHGNSIYREAEDEGAIMDLSYHQANDIHDALQEFAKEEPSDEKINFVVDKMVRDAQTIVQALFPHGHLDHGYFTITDFKGFCYPWEPAMAHAMEVIESSPELLKFLDHI